MAKQEILLDSDGVLFEFLEKLLKLYNAEYNDNLAVNDITEFDLSKFSKPGADIQKYFYQSGYFRDLPVIAGAQYYTKKLVKDGHDVMVATHSPKIGIVDKIDAILENYPHIPEENIIPIKRKEKLYGDILLDDGLHNILSTRCKYPVIFDYPWNRSLVGEYASLVNVKRIYNWKQFYEYVCEIASQKYFISLYSEKTTFSEAGVENK